MKYIIIDIPRKSQGMFITYNPFLGCSYKIFNAHVPVSSLYSLSPFIVKALLMLWLMQIGVIYAVSPISIFYLEDRSIAYDHHTLLYCK